MKSLKCIVIGMLLITGPVLGGCDDDSEKVSELEDKVTALESEVETLESEKTTLESTNSTLESDKATLESDKATLEGEKTTLEGEKSALESQVSDLSGQVDTLGNDKTTLEGEVATLTTDNASLQGEVDGLTAENGMLMEIAGPPPAWLDRLYPPAAMGPVLMFEMFGLSTPLVGMMNDMQAGDMANVPANLAAFRTQYENMATNVVPEWADRFPIGPVDDLEAAIAAGDPAQIGPAMEALGGVCGSCHGVYLTKVQQKYHWPDFRNVMITDPLSSQDMVWADYMFAVDGPFVGIMNDLMQGDVAAAQADHAAFDARFQELRNGCQTSGCHTTPRAYFVDQSVQDNIDALGAELAMTTPDPAVVGGLVGAIGGASCGPCHLVHTPAANAKRLWAEWPNLFP